LEGHAMQFMNLAYQASSDCDVLVANVPHLGGSFAELGKIPSLHLAYFPHIPTRSFAPATAKYDIGLLNPLAYRIEARVLEKPFLPMINRWRSHKGLAPLPLGRNDGRMDGYRQPVLHPFSRYLCPPPREWDGRAEAIGFLQLPVEQGWTPPADLDRFIDSGSAPIYIGFGSMVGADPERVTGIVLRALAGTGIRAVLHGGWGGLAIRQTEVPVHFLQGDVPHSALFARMAAVVHHGGPGTIATALRLGLPQLSVPFIPDQRFWGRRLARNGLGPSPIDIDKLSVSKLRSALRQLVSTASYRERAQLMRRQVNSENAGHHAVVTIESLVSSSTSPVRQAAVTSSFRAELTHGT
ncbi:glycosyltransferase, partial [Dyella silvatica]|uniref:glycosyltransferase n=1 Tax=Dyella silvatica TaxID=2992128 RepID=UPI002259A864